ncbi:hypothetical protein HYH03_005310 [Edaphochlamys debaryana]|uniref:Protein DETOXIFICATION n=1 Tax=Edaphochlamys debaryana TaxID=47281 RepID=A0A835Y5F5_9CHLO|nr:hypothetical protein HYH03_005310 [Edaphochlamys debaryana]|eukprot:KAG2496485.1 hypothetical protein HYH03_005310 [Edaphochlamys debaryana]
MVSDDPEAGREFSFHPSGSKPQSQEPAPNEAPATTLAAAAAAAGPEAPGCRNVMADRELRGAPHPAPAAAEAAEPACTRLLPSTTVPAGAVLPAAAVPLHTTAGAAAAPPSARAAAALQPHKAKAATGRAGSDADTSTVGSCSSDEEGDEGEEQAKEKGEAAKGPVRVPTLPIGGNRAGEAAGTAPRRLSRFASESGGGGGEERGGGRSRGGEGQQEGLREQLLHRPRRRRGGGRALGKKGLRGEHAPSALSLLRQELMRVLALALPTSSVDVVSFLASLVGLFQVARLGTAELSALTLGSTLFNLTGLSWAVGLTSGMDTLCGQVYGAGLYGAVGLLFQRAVLVCNLACLPAYVLWSRAEWLLLAMGQPPAASRLAAGYVRTAAPCLALSTTKFCCRAYFTAQGVVLPVTIITFVCTLLAPLYNYAFITWLEGGLNGAALAYAADEATALLLLAAAMALHAWRQPPGRRTWAGWDRGAWSGWGAYMAVALPSTAMSCLDWWVLEVMVLLAGLGPDPDNTVAAMGLCFNAFTLAYYAVAGFGDAAATRVAHALGAGRGRAARRAAAVALGSGLAVCCAAVAALLLGGEAWTAAFSDSPQVRAAVRRALPLVGVAVTGYAAGTVAAGVLRGAGRQTLGARVNLLTLWFVGLPLAAVLGLWLRLGNVGLWGGIAVMLVLQGGVVAARVMGLDWEGREVARSRSVVSLHASTFGGDEVGVGGVDAGVGGGEAGGGGGDGGAWWGGGVGEGEAGVDGGGEAGRLGGLEGEEEAVVVAVAPAGRTDDVEGDEEGGEGEDEEGEEEEDEGEEQEEGEEEEEEGWSGSESAARAAEERRQRSRGRVLPSPLRRVVRWLAGADGEPVAEEVPPPEDRSAGSESGEEEAGA